MRTLLLFLVALCPLAADDKSALLEKMNARAAHYGDVSRTIWEFAEVGYKEHKSAALVDKNMRLVGGVTYTAEERAFAETIRKTLADRTRPLGSQENVEAPSEDVGSASTDAGDVSWTVPMAALVAATFVPGVPAHSWQSAACAGMSIGRKGMVVAAKSLVLTAVDLYTDPWQVAAAKAGFEKRRAGYEYKSRIPADHQPPLNYRNNP